MPDSPRASNVTPAVTVLSRRPTEGTKPPPGAIEAAWRSRPGVMGNVPLLAENQNRFCFRISGDEPIELDVLTETNVWTATKKFGDLIINRVTLGQANQVTLRIEGITRQGELVAINGWYEMNGQVFHFGPAPRGHLVDVDVPHALSCENCLEHFSFTVVAQSPGNEPYIYDPTLLLAPKKGQCNGQH